MGIAALVLGIVSILISCIPFCGIIAFIPAIIGGILAIIELVNKQAEKTAKGMSIAGLILSGLSILILLGWIMTAAFGTTEYDRHHDFYTDLYEDEDSIFFDEYDWHRGPNTRHHRNLTEEEKEELENRITDKMDQLENKIDSIIDTI